MNKNKGTDRKNVVIVACVKEIRQKAASEQNKTEL